MIHDVVVVFVDVGLVLELLDVLAVAPFFFVPLALEDLLLDADALGFLLSNHLSHLLLADVAATAAGLVGQVGGA